MIRFLHAADLHLDTPFKGMAHLPKTYYEAVQQSTFTAFSNFIDYAVTVRPDFVVIVGDLYDGEHRSLSAQLKFQEGMKRLQQVNVPVFITYGNHDHLSGRWTRFDLPDNVQVFSSEVEEKTLTIRGEIVHIHGFSYAERHIREAKVDAYPVAANTEDFHIGLLHGSVEGDKEHAVYAPFTKAQLLGKRYDYWALGHIHKRQQLHAHPPIVYPGNTQGRHRNERGEKGFYDVQLSKEETTLQFVPVNPIVFDQVTVSCVGMKHAGEWIEACQEAIEQLQMVRQGAMIEVVCTDLDEGATVLFQQSLETEWLDLLRESCKGREPFIWIEALHFEYAIYTRAADHALLQPVYETMDNWSSEDWQEVLKDLYGDPRHMALLETLAEEQYNEIKEQAQRRLQMELANRR